jgi:hypothetical protein
MTTTRIKLSDPEYDRISQLVRKSYPNACIVQIGKVENKILTSRFEDKFSQMKEKYSNTSTVPKIIELFHGTRENNVWNIVNTGFLTSKNVTSAYGIGTYLSNLAHISWSYSLKRTTKSSKEDSELAYMILCDVIIGEIRTKNDQNLELEIVSVNDLINPTIYCVPYEEGVCPKYVIEFYRYA